MKNLASVLFAGAAGVAVLQWWQIAYRLRLFLTDCHGERGVNHIGDGAFTFIYIVNAILLAGVVFALRVFWRDGRGWRIATGVVGLGNAFGWLTFAVMHRTGVLVEYGEFILH